MRTTFTLDDDVAAEVQRLRRDEGLGLSEAVNRLIRAGMAAPARSAPYRHRSVRVGLKVDVTDIGAVLELSTNPDAAGRQPAVVRRGRRQSTQRGGWPVAHGSAQR